jgi:hypothetical protein
MWTRYFRIIRAGCWRRCVWALGAVVLEALTESLQAANPDAPAPRPGKKGEPRAPKTVDWLPEDFVKAATRAKEPRPLVKESARWIEMRRSVLELERGVKVIPAAFLLLDSPW